MQLDKLVWPALWHVDSSTLTQVRHVAQEIKAVPKELPHFDQRIIYTHSLLAFTGHDVYLALIDVDE